MNTVKILESTDDVLRLEVLGTSFSDGTKKDLGGEWFHNKTYFGLTDDDGAPAIKVKPAMYDHLHNGLTNSAAPTQDPRMMEVGIAKYLREDDWGRWFEIEVKKGLAYRRYLEQLAEMKMLGASTQCFPGGKTMDPETGRIDVWLENEITLTVTPMDQDTVGTAKVINDLIKSLEIDLPQVLVSEEVVSEGVAEQVSDSAASDVPSLNQQVEEILSGGLPEESEPIQEEEPASDPVQSVEVQELSQQVQVLSEEVAALKTMLSQQISSVVTALNSQEAAQEPVMKTLEDMGTTVMTLASFVRKAVTVSAATDTQKMTPTERAVLDHDTKFPDNRNSSGQFAEWRERLRNAPGA